jgi:DNA-binding MltR family transcriptional regulator
MNEDDKTISEQSKNIHDEFQSLSANAKIAESAEAVEKARQAIIKIRIRRRKRTVIIK